MATKKDAGMGRYLVLRDVGVPGAAPGDQGQFVLAGETIELAGDVAALLIRDGMVAPAEEA